MMLDNGSKATILDLIGKLNVVLECEFFPRLHKHHTSMCTDGKSSEGIFVDGASGHMGQDLDLTTLSLLASCNSESGQFMTFIY